jgi:hypothetical protein
LVVGLREADERIEVFVSVSKLPNADYTYYIALSTTLFLVGLDLIMLAKLFATTDVVNISEFGGNSAAWGCYF